MPPRDPEHFDIAVVGAGPAGMAAAIRAAEAGVRVALLDEQSQAGGAIWRGFAAATGPRRRSLAMDDPTGFAMLDRLQGTDLALKLGATLWEVTRNGIITYAQGGVARQLSARRIILATGALERPMPFPGWTLPGVMTAGGAQIMLKTSGLTPPGPLVLAGSGPLLMLVAVQLLAAGTPPSAIIDTTPRGNLAAALRHLPMRSPAWRMIVQGLGWRRQLRRAGVAVHRGACELEALGEERLSGVRFKCRGQMVDLTCSTLLIHNGLVPNVQISRSIGLVHDWDEPSQAWHPRSDTMGRTDIDGFLVAGDGAGIAGAEAAVHSGRLAALAALAGSASVSEAEIAREQRALTRHRAIRPFLDQLFASAPDFLRPADDTIVCRCEEVTAGKVRQLVRRGCHDPNAVKSLGRAGMGPCQGRYCGLTVSQLVAQERGIPVAEAGYFRLRSPLKPVSLGELASLQPAEADNDG